MARFSGSAMHLAWIWTGGTINLHSEFREFSYSPTLSLIDASAGSDTFRNYLPGIGEGGDISLTMVMPTYSTGGTALLAALASGNQGTLIYGPEGTATGRPKVTIPAFSRGPSFTQPYDDVVELMCGFQQSSAASTAAY